MNTSLFNSKNLRTLSLTTALSCLGLVVIVLFAGDSGNYGQLGMSHYKQALLPLLHTGLPILILVGVLLGIFTFTREEGKDVRIWSGILLLINFGIAYVLSYILTTVGW